MPTHRVLYFVALLRYMITRHVSVEKAAVLSFALLARYRECRSIDLDFLPRLKSSVN
jgi:hypothetical protein